MRPYRLPEAHSFFRRAIGRCCSQATQLFAPLCTTPSVLAADTLKMLNQLLLQINKGVFSGHQKRLGGLLADELFAWNGQAQSDLSDIGMVFTFLRNDTEPY